jgi:acylglycerol lipase
LLLLAGCVVPESNVPPGPATVAEWVRTAQTEPPVEPPRAPLELVAEDGTTLPLRVWLPAGEVRAAIVAVHGMNDYSHAFEAVATALAWHGVATYAYDQRGFGEAPWRGLWVGRRVLAEDLAAATRFVHGKHPGVKLTCLGESMGGAVVMVAVTGESGAERPACDAVILSAPAVWGRETQDLMPRVALWLGVRLFPETVLTGRQLHIRPSDNLSMLRALARDPLVIKGTRIDTIYGLVDLMDAALASAASLDVPALFLYGNRDEIIPRAPTELAIERMPPEPASRRRIAWYVNGYHMLLRDLQAGVVYNDIASWLFDPAAPLPSGADHVADTVLEAARGGS